ncbi:MAG: aminodeoxychorismate lyase [Candidatus Marinimicrobia bacterium]|nr:aminodeoxychorismate lyase [Candidatus Neomarinimicrobiota bacterium]
MKKATSISVTIALMILLFSYYNIMHRDNTNFDEDSTFIYINSSDSIVSILDTINQKIKYPKTFLRAAKRMDYTENIKSGRFKVNKGAGNKEIINSLKFNNTSLTVTFNNQERIQDLVGTVSRQILADSISLLNAFLEKSFLEDNGFDDLNSMSMYIPNSYNIYWNTSPEDFRDRMLEEYNKFWNQDRSEKAKSLGLTRLEVISLASIVQIESRKIDERPRVAGLYINRLRDNMRLQADPTVIYTIKEYYKNFDTIIRRVLYRDLKLDSEFNTYKIKGLPPGPITMSDISAIDAVLNYEKHNYLYMVANPYNRGYHLFASDLSEHNRNRKVYIRWINSRGIYR